LSMMCFHFGNASPSGASISEGGPRARAGGLPGSRQCCPARAISVRESVKGLESKGQNRS
jgi:hypothetical protein